MEPEVVLGPPGTGKTTHLLGIVEDELSSGTPPDRIGFVSFTRRAAEEAIGRAATRFSLSRKDLPFFRTLHSLAFRALGRKSGEILEGTRLQEFGELVGHKITGRFSMEDGTIFGFERGDRLLFMENLARVRGVPLSAVYEEDHDDLSLLEVERFAAALREYKAELGIADFTDLILEFCRSGIQLSLDVLLVDEAQDLSLLQWEMVRKLAVGARRVVIAGDDDQCLYRWAGADVETFVSMPGRVTVLDQSWRVPRTVQAVAADVVGRVRHRREKAWRPRPEDGSVVRHRSLASFDFSTDGFGDGNGDVLVLGRNRYILKEVEGAIRSAGYLYEFQGVRSIRDSILRCVLSWERLRQGREGVTTEDARKMYELISVGTGVRRGHKLLPDLPEDGPVTMQDLLERGGLLVDPAKLWWDALDKMPTSDVAYIRAALRRRENLQAAPRIRLSTIHGMKGGEGTRVVLLTDVAARTHLEAQRWPDDENRVWYVAATRAKQELHIVAPRTGRNFSL